jgi:hypothetical protein
MNSPTPTVARRRILTFVFAVLVTLSPWTPVVQADTTALDRGFEGLVRDSFGNVVSDVEILFISVLDPLSTSPQASVRTDAAGRFKVASLHAGSYQVAAIKAGYRTLLSQVHTDSGRWLPMVLMPEATALEQGVPLPQDRRWGLRLPRRHLLRETKPAIAQRMPFVESTLADSESPSSDLQIRVDQYVQVMTDLRRLPEDEPVLQGLATRLQLNGVIGPRAQLGAQAQRQRLSSSKYLGRNSATTSRSQDRLSASLDYELSSVAEIDADLRFTRRSARWSPRELPGAEALDHDVDDWQAQIVYQQMVGTSSTWESELQIDSSELEILNGPNGFTSLQQRAWSLQNRFTMQRTSRHRMKWQLGWTQLDTVDPQQRQLRATPIDGSPSAIRRDGSQLALTAQHTMQLDSRWALLYGGHWSQALHTVAHPTGNDDALLAPEIGFRLTTREIALQWVATYFDSEPLTELGFKAQVEWLIDPMTELQVEWVEEPTMRATALSSPPQAVSSATPYVTDGDVARSQARVTLRGRIPALDWFAELGVGQLQGSVAAVMPYDLPFQELNQRDLEFLSGRFGLTLVPYGTSLSIALQQMKESVDVLDHDRGATHRSIEFALAQRVMQRDDLGQWRFLLALSLARLASDDAGQLRQVVSTEPLQSTDGRLTAGLSLEF